MTIKNWWFFPLVLTCCIAIFYPSFNYYFFQDDWFVLNWISQENIASFFQFRTDIIYWRPLTMPVFFALGKQIFGLDPFGYHLITFIFHFLNSILIYVLFKKLKLTSSTSKFSAFIYAISAFHFIGLSWLSTTSYVIGTTLILSTIYSFLKSKYTFSFLFFLLALASTEFSIICIPLLLLIRNFSKKTFLQLFPHLSLAAIYLAVRFLIFPIPAQGNYGLGLNLTTLTNISWYFLWVFNFAEKFSTIFFVSNIKEYPYLILSQFNYLIFPIILIFSSILLVLITNLNKREIFFGLSWFLISLTPVILIPKHTYPIYLIIASLGIIYILARTLDSLKKRKISAIIFISSIWLISSFLTLDFTRKTHWISNQQSISKAYTNFIKNKILQPTNNSFFIIKPADINYSKINNFTLVETEQNVKQSFNDQDAIQVIYDNPTLKSLFPTHQETIKVPPGSSIYEILPRIE